ncbi:hypothetical protein ACLB2K_004028 [Fragaria x ananassa]
MSAQIVGFEELKNQHGDDPYFSSIIAELKGPTGWKMLSFKMHDGYLFKGNSLCIPADSLREQIIRELHDNGLGGHFGRDKTLSMVTDRYYWPRMYKDVSAHPGGAPGQSHRPLIMPGPTRRAHRQSHR